MYQKKKNATIIKNFHFPCKKIPKIFQITKIQHLLEQNSQILRQLLKQCDFGFEFRLPIALLLPSGNLPSQLIFVVVRLFGRIQSLLQSDKKINVSFQRILKSPHSPFLSNTRKASMTSSLVFT